MEHKLRACLFLLCFCPMLSLGQNVLSALENMHSISKGETWESIAADYGISVSELQTANPDMKNKKLKKGKLLIIPKKTQVVPAAEVSEESLPVIRSSFPNLKVGILLPFGDKKMLEFYRGFLMSADSVRQSGTNLDIYAWDCGSTIAQIEPLLPRLSELDVIFGPASPVQVPAVAEVCRERGIRLVLPFLSGQAMQDYPLVYDATAPAALVHDVAADYLVRHYAERNFVIVHTGNGDNHGHSLTETLSQNLTRQTKAPRVLELEGDDVAYESAFDQFRDNMIVLDDSSIRSLNIITARLKEFHQKHPNYRFSLIGYPEWQDETDRLLADFFAFDTYIISPSYYNVLDDRTRHFQHTYEKIFRTPIIQSNPRFAAFGFDLGYFFLKGISCLGDTFEQMQGNLHQEPYQNWFQFKRNVSGMSFSNHFVQLIHFTPENKIELIR